MDVRATLGADVALDLGGLYLQRAVWGPGDEYALLGRLLQVTICAEGILGG